MFYGFFDASNTHDDANVWALCGFLADQDSFIRLDAEWNAVLDKPCWRSRLKRFHTVECVRQQGECAAWPFAERLALFGELASIVISTPCAAVASVVIKDDFQKLDPEELGLLASEGLGAPLDLSLQSILQRSLELMRNTSNSEKIGIIFDNGDVETNKRICDISEHYKIKFGYEDCFDGIGFGKNVEFTPLQAADLLAYGTYRYTMQKYPEIPDPDFPVIPAFMRMVEGIVGDAKGGFDLESMRSIVGMIRSKRQTLTP